MSAPIVLGVVAVVVIVAGSIIFNRLVRLRNLTRESWRDVDAELQRRYDLIPNLVNTVKGYAAYERSTLDAVTAVRAEAMESRRVPDQQAAQEQALGRGVERVLAVAERYPELHASQQFLNLQQELATTEDRIQVARRIYNANVRAYDTLIATFPAVLLARPFGFTASPYFELDPIVRDAGPPPVDLSGRT